LNILLTGGSACGKSTFGEALAARLPKREPTLPPCARSKAKARKKSFAINFSARTRLFDRRAGNGFSGLRLPARGTVLLECVCNLAANEMFDDTAISAPARRKQSSAVSKR
jgi:adenosylcobinamide kinase/adenosylcobinamide-phosphate guanylyltransferase